MKSVVVHVSCIQGKSVLKDLLWEVVRVCAWESVFVLAALLLMCFL